MFSNLQINEQELPALEQVVFKPLDQHATKEALISTFLFVLPISAAILLMATFVAKAPQNILMYLALAVLCVNLYIAWFTVAFVKSTGIALREHDLVLKRGVFWQKNTAVPFSRIQHIETHRNPIERQFGLSSIKFFTAGGMGADLELHGLAIERASRMRQYILDKEQCDNEPS